MFLRKIINITRKLSSYTKYHDFLKKNHRFYGKTLGIQIISEFFQVILRGKIIFRQILNTSYNSKNKKKNINFYKILYHFGTCNFLIHSCVYYFHFHIWNNFRSNFATASRDNRKRIFIWKWFIFMSRQIMSFEVIVVNEFSERKLMKFLLTSRVVILTSHNKRMPDIHFPAQYYVCEVCVF